MSHAICPVIENGRICGRSVEKREWCNTHYYRWRVNGDPLVVRTHRKPRGFTDVEWFWAGYKRAANGCLEWQRGTVRGYGVCSVNLGGDSRLAHRMAWTLLNGPIPDGLLVLHHCDNPPCGDVAGGHLFLGTKADNSADMAAKLRSTIGESAPAAKLTGDQVLVIRTMFATTNLSDAKIAPLFGVTRIAIRKIRFDQSWTQPEFYPHGSTTH